MKCYNCGNEQASGRFCDHCGMMITKIIVDNDPSDKKGSARDKYEDARPRRLKCKCGHVQAQGRFCDNCGMMLDYYRSMPSQEFATARCPQCGGMSTNPVCGNCGIKIPGFSTEANQ